MNFSGFYILLITAIVVIVTNKVCVEREPPLRLFAALSFCKDTNYLGNKKEKEEKKQAQGMYMEAQGASGGLCLVGAGSAIGEMLPVLEVVEVVLVAVGFLFEADVAVGLHVVAVLEEQDEPLQEVPEEEGQVEQFLLLGHVD